MKIKDEIIEMIQKIDNEKLLALLHNLIKEMLSYYGQTSEED